MSSETAPPQGASTQGRRPIPFLKTDRAKFVAMVLFLVAVFLMGGGSRSDILSLVMLRPLSIGLIAYALSVADRREIAALGTPLFLLSALAVLIALQLIPLPPGLWASLSGREPYAGAVAAAGVDGIWRPLSLAPAATLNSLFSLSVPFAALMLFAVQGVGYRRRALMAIAALGLLSALWGLLQLAGSPTGPLYLYSVTNDGMPVGLFANRNHQAVLLAGLIPLIAHLALTARSRSGRTLGGAVAAALAAGLLLVATLLMTGSRAGLLALVIAIAATAFILRVEGLDFRASVKRPRRSSGWRPIGAVVGAVVIAVAVVLWFGQAVSLERLFATDRVEDMRSRLLPILAEMATSFFPVGAGFGTFDAVYDHFEPVALLNDHYLNQAHNDWFQLVIEGGIAAALILLAFLVWLSRQALQLVRDMRSNVDANVTRRIAALGFLLIIGVASLFDYPLRVPSMMAVFAIFCALLGSGRAREDTGD